MVFLRVIMSKKTILLKYGGELVSSAGGRQISEPALAWQTVSAYTGGSAVKAQLQFQGDMLS